MRVPGYSPGRADGIIRSPKPNEEIPVKIREIDEQLALEHENLSAAKEASKRAIAASLKDRNNPNLRANVAISDGEVKSIEAVIADLQEQAKAAAEKQAKQAEMDANRANQKQPDTSALLSAAQQSGKSGASGTMLTGPSGIDASSLSLGKTTLLVG